MSVSTAEISSGFGAVTPVFYDASRRRWTGFTAAFGLLVLAGLGVFTLLGLSVAHTPSIGAIPLAAPTLTASANVGPSPAVEPLVAPRPMAPLVRIAPSPAPQLAKTPQAAPEREIASAAPALANVPLPRPRPVHAANPKTLRKPLPPAVPVTASIRSPSFVTLGAASISVTPPGKSGSSFVSLPSAKKPTPVETVLGAVFSVLVPPVHAQEYMSEHAEPEIQAFFVNWDHASASSLSEHIRQIDVLVPAWLALKDAGGELTFDMSQRTLRTLALRENTHPDLRIMPLLTNYAEGQYQVEWLRSVMSSSRSAQALADNLVAYLVENDFDGVTLRLSGLSEADRPAHRRFLEILAPALSSRNLRLQHVVNIEGGPLDPAAFEDLVDVLVIEAYGQSVAGDRPGPLASQDWFETYVAQWTQRLPASKLVFSLGNLAYDWPAQGPAETISLLDAYGRAENGGATIALDPASLNSTFTYRAADGGAHTVWMLDGVSMFNQARALSGTGIRGLALDRLGTEDASAWQVLSSPYSGLVSALETIDFSYQIARNGSGEIIKLVDLPKPGARNVTASAAGERIIAAGVTGFPRAYKIDHWGPSDPMVVALTFDDGPDPVYTTQVLDILETYNVPATFFAVGAQMLRHPDIVRRIIADGHEIGSHTYSHVNISTLSPEMLRLDLNATQRVFESITGRHMAMFRAPYAVDANPQTPSEIAPLATVGALGYVTVNMNVDPVDWWLPTAARIASDTISGIEGGAGNVVLLHDGGGNRQPTVDALPEIIETLRVKGYRFVSVSELVGLTADEVMPVATSAAGPLAAVQHLGFTLLREGEKLVVGLFVMAIGLGVARSLFLIVLSVLHRPHRRIPAAQSRLRVGVIVPAYNEEKVVLKTVRSLLASDYANLKILVVDDGSKDNTYALCRDTFAEEPRVTIVTKPNGGKAAALNYGIGLLDVDVVVALDADTIFLPDAVSRLVSHFHDDRVAAVAGNAKVGNRLNLLTRWQAVEYITAQNLDRRAFDMLNCINVVPGAIGAWWRDTLVELGGFSTDTLAEDADLTIRILRAGYKVTYDEGAIAYTEAPETTRQLLKQRFRWMFGMLQVAQKHRGALALRDSISFALVGLPNIVFFQILFPLLAPVADLMAILALVSLGMQLAGGSGMMGAVEAMTFLAMFGAFIILDFLVAAIAFFYEKREDWRLLLWLLPQRFYYRQLLYIVAIQAVLAAIRGSMVGWGNLDRSASVPALGQPMGR